MIDLEQQTVREYIQESRTGFWKMELRDGAELTFGIAVLRVRITGLPAAFDDEATLPSSRRGGNSFPDDEMTR